MPQFFKRRGSFGGPAAKRARTSRTIYSRSFAKRRRTRRDRGRRGRNPAVYTKFLKMPVPDRIFTKLRYAEFFDLAPQQAGTPGMVSYSFRSSLFDPNYTGLGHQPLWHDQLQAMYGRYRVIGMKYRFVLCNTNTNQLCTMAVEKADGPPQNPAVGYTTILERRGVRPVNINPSQSNPTIVQGYMHVGKPYGLTKTDFMADEDFEANFGANPAKMSYINLYCVTQNTSAIVNCQASIEYYVEIQKQVLVAQS